MRYNPLEIARTIQKRIAPLITKRFFRIIFFLPVICTIGTVILIAVYFSQLPPEIPLYYSKPWGEDQLTQPIYLFILPLGSLIWYVITTFVIAFETYQYRVFAQLLLIFSLLISLFSTYTVIMILVLIL